MVDLLLARGGLANGAQAVRNNVTRPQPCDLRSVAPRSPRNSDAPDRAVRSYHYLHAHAQRGTPPIWSTPRSTWPRFGKASSGGIRRSRPPHIISVGSLSFGDPAGIGAEIRLSKSLAQRTAISRAHGHVEVSVDQLGRHLGRVAIDIAHARFDQASRCHDLKKTIQHRQPGEPKPERYRCRDGRVAARIHQYELVDAVGHGAGRLPRHTAADRIAAEYAALDTEFVEQRADETDICRDRVIAFRRRASQAEGG